MCRYGEYGPYKKHYACFYCRKAFKRLQEHEWPTNQQPSQEKDAPAPCPDCGEPMANMGLDFKPPKQTNREHWEVLEFLFERGIAFHACGCVGPGFRPSKWSEVDAFLQSRFVPSPGAALLEKFETRKRS